MSSTPINYYNHFKPAFTSWFIRSESSLTQIPLFLRIESPIFLAESIFHHLLGDFIPIFSWNIGSLNVLHLAIFSFFLGGAVITVITSYTTIAPTAIALFSQFKGRPLLATSSCVGAGGLVELHRGAKLGAVFDLVGPVSTWPTAKNYPLWPPFLRCMKCRERKRGQV